MKKLSHAIAKLTSFTKTLRLDRLFVTVLVGFLLLATSVDSRQSDRPLEQEVRQEIQEANQKSERPKTTGEFKQEARGDVPATERIYNITRDSAESLKQFAEEYPRVTNKDAAE